MPVKLPGEAETWLDIFPIRLPIGAFIRAVEYLAAAKRWQPRHGKRRCGIRIEPIHPIVALCSGQGHVIAKAQIESQLREDLPVVLSKCGILKILRRRLELDLVILLVVIWPILKLAMASPPHCVISGIGHCAVPVLSKPK